MRVHYVAIVIALFLATALPAVSRAQVIINEVMQNPDFISDSEGEWFELHNAGATDIDINGWTVSDNGGDSHVIDNGSPLILPSCGFIVLGRNADTLVNGNVPVSYAYGTDVSLGNGADQIVIQDADGNEVDRIEYDDGVTFPDPSGASMELRHPSLDNGVGVHWAEAVSSWSGNDLGTPGFVNSVFDSVAPQLSSVTVVTEVLLDVAFDEPVEKVSAELAGNYSIDPDIGVPISAARDPVDSSLVHLTVSPLVQGILYTLRVSGIQDLPGNTIASDSLTFILTGEPKDGDVIVTEIMKDPSAVNDSDGEWFEVYNTTDFPIDVGGWTVTDGGSNTFTISGSFVIAAESFALFTLNTDSATNGGFHAERMYDWGTSTTFTLGNAADKIILLANGTMIDSVSYDDGTLWPDTTGASIGLSDFSLENNDGGNWTIAPSREPEYIGTTGDLGSPGTLGTNQSQGIQGVFQVDPGQLDFVMGREERYSLQLTVKNNGSDELLWQIADSDLTGDCFWLSEDPSSGMIPPGGESQVNVTADAAGVPPQEYQCSIVVFTDEPGVPPVTIPVSLRILDTMMTGSLAVDPDVLPVPAAGDTIPFSFLITNLTGVSRSTDVWLSLELPSGSITMPVFGPRNPEVDPFDTLMRSKQVKIPEHAPAGAYRLVLSLGTYPDSVDFEADFTFEKEEKTDEKKLTSPILGSNYPNPFNSSTRIAYGLTEDTWVTIRVYNLLGQELVTLTDGFRGAGFHEVIWSGENSRGDNVGTGIYLYVMKAGSILKTGRMVILR